MKPIIIYGAGVDRVGIWGPFKMTWDEELNEYFDKSGNFSVLNIDEHHNTLCGIITFASVDKNEVDIWIKGVKAAMKMLKNWCAL